MFASKHDRFEREASADDRVRRTRGARATGKLSPDGVEDETAEDGESFVFAGKHDRSNFGQRCNYIPPPSRSLRGAGAGGCNGADDRVRTGTGVKSHRILSPRRLPVSPHRLDMQSTV